MGEFLKCDQLGHLRSLSFGQNRPGDYTVLNQHPDVHIEMLLILFVDTSGFIKFCDSNPKHVAI